MEWEGGGVEGGGVYLAAKYQRYRTHLSAFDSVEYSCLAARRCIPSPLWRPTSVRACWSL